MLEKANLIADYWKTWIHSSELIAVLPALNIGEGKCMPYYSVRSLDETCRLSPVFIYRNNCFIDITQNNSFKRTPEQMLFIFDTEFDKLYSYEKKKHTNSYHHVKRPTYDAMKAHIESHPIVLFFHGCDDGHVGMRFKTEADAVEYLQCISVFEDVFDEKDLQYHN